MLRAEHSGVSGSVGQALPFAYAARRVIRPDLPRRRLRPPDSFMPYRNEGMSETSNDNPFSESLFTTLKYEPRFPQRFGCIEDAKSFCRRFSIGTTGTITMQGSA
jgi:hypothetical protein